MRGGHSWLKQIYIMYKLLESKVHLVGKVIFCLQDALEKSKEDRGGGTTSIQYLLGTAVVRCLLTEDMERIHFK